jgi:hypothetical protein
MTPTAIAMAAQQSNTTKLQTCISSGVPSDTYASQMPKSEAAKL